MRGIILFSIFLTLAACGGSLSDEQRKALKEEMKQREIKQVSDDEIFEKALAWGRQYVAELKNGNEDSVAQAHGVTIEFADSTSAVSDAKKKLMEAYAYANSEDINDNVQKDDTNILYSYPVADSNALKGVWFITIPKKKIVLAL